MATQTKTRNCTLRRIISIQTLHFHKIRFLTTLPQNTITAWFFSLCNEHTLHKTKGKVFLCFLRLHELDET